MGLICSVDEKISDHTAAEIIPDMCSGSICALCGKCMIDYNNYMYESECPMVDQPMYSQ